MLSATPTFYEAGKRSLQEIYFKKGNLRLIVFRLAVGFEKFNNVKFHFLEFYFINTL